MQQTGTKQRDSLAILIGYEPLVPIVLVPLFAGHLTTDRDVPTIRPGAVVSVLHPEVRPGLRYQNPR